LIHIFSSHDDLPERIRRAGGFVVHKRVMGELAVSRAIGDMEFKEKGFVFVVANPEIDVRQINADDEFLLLACDGLYDVMTNKEACEFIRGRLYDEHMSAQQVTDEIVKHAIDKLNTRDNVTAIIVRFKQQVDTSADPIPLNAVQKSSSTHNTATHLPAEQASQRPSHTESQSQDELSYQSINNTTNANDPSAPYLVHGDSEMSTKAAGGNNEISSSSDHVAATPSSKLSKEDSDLVSSDVTRNTSRLSISDPSIFDPPT
jgi:serine/threonine protein phosphatase PrpC